MADVVLTTEQLIAAAVDRFRAPRGERLISTVAGTMRVRTRGERVLLLPNGAKVKVSVDDSGCATQIEENDALHAIARPHTLRIRVRNDEHRQEATWLR